MPASRSSRRPSSVSPGASVRASPPWLPSIGNGARAYTAASVRLKSGPTVSSVILAADHERIGLVRQQLEGSRRQPIAGVGVRRIVVVGPPAETLEPGVVLEREPERGPRNVENPNRAPHDPLGDRVELGAGRELARELEQRLRRHAPRAAPLRRGVRSRRQPRHARRAPRESGGRRCRTGRSRASTARARRRRSRRSGAGRRGATPRSGQCPRCGGRCRSSPHRR